MNFVTAEELQNATLNFLGDYVFFPFVAYTTGVLVKEIKDARLFPLSWVSIVPTIVALPIFYLIGQVHGDVSGASSSKPFGWFIWLAISSIFWFGLAKGLQKLSSRWLALASLFFAAVTLVLTPIFLPMPGIVFQLGCFGWFFLFGNLVGKSSRPSDLNLAVFFTVILAFLLGVSSLLTSSFNAFRLLPLMGSVDGLSELDSASTLVGTCLLLMIGSFAAIFVHKLYIGEVRPHGFEADWVHFLTFDIASTTVGIYLVSVIEARIWPQADSISKVILVFLSSWVIVSIVSRMRANYLSKLQRIRSLNIRFFKYISVLLLVCLVPFIEDLSKGDSLGTIASQTQQPSHFVSAVNAPKPLSRVAHAGAAVQGVSYTNSLEALNENKSFFEWFELDLLSTSDGRVVCLHDWGESAMVDLGIDFSGMKNPTFSTFQRLNKASGKFNNCDEVSLATWLANNPDKRIVTDTKEFGEKMPVLLRLKQVIPNWSYRIIPQIYNENQYFLAKQLGFKDIIFTLYALDVPPGDAIQLALGKDLLAVTTPKEWSELVGPVLEEANLSHFVHTVNSSSELRKIQEYGVDEIYTDFLR